jgi:hypothetical protein
MNLTTDPWNMNRYAFAGGNPISIVELDGHCGVLTPVCLGAAQEAIKWGIVALGALAGGAALSDDNVREGISDVFRDRPPMVE